MKRVIAIASLSLIYTGVLVFSKILKIYSRKITRTSGVLLVNCTFHNPNWFHSHITPLTQSGFKKVILVTDAKLENIEGLIFACPPIWLQKIFSRAGAKFFWTIYCGIKYRPDLYMGYHIFPSAITVLLVARLFNRPACYQVTSGPIELRGGGWDAENKLLSSLQRQSSLIEKIVNSLVRQFDLVVVRGNTAKSYIKKIGNKKAISIITGSVQMPKSILPYNERNIDIIFVGRLTEHKRLDRLVNVIKKVKQRISNIKVVIVGDGPDYQKLLLEVERLDLSKNIEFMGQRKDVIALLKKSKIFVLTSKTEGVSIAMLEAMSNGVVPVVTNVGDLKDFIVNGFTGYIHDQNDVAGMADNIVDLLGHVELYSVQSKNCYKLIDDKSSLNAISDKWKVALMSAINEYH